MSDDDEPGALVPRAEPRFEIARSLADAKPNTLIHVDRRGQVRSPARFKAVQAASYALLGGSIVAFTIVYGTLFGPLGAGLGLGLAGLFGWRIRRGLAMRRGVVLLVNDRVEEALPIFEKVVAARVPRRMKALAHQNLAACHSRRGRHAEALEHERAAIKLHGARPHALALSVRYAEIITLVNLDRVAEAHAELVEQFPKVPDGEYLRIQHWACELYLALAGADIAVPDDELHERARYALGLTAGTLLLGLLAWAHHRAGDLDQAWHLLREALDRRSNDQIRQTVPKLHAWMEAHAAEARAAFVDDYR